MNRNTIKQTAWAIPLMVALSNIPANTALTASNFHSMSLIDAAVSSHLEPSRQAIKFESITKGEQQLANRAVPIRWS